MKLAIVLSWVMLAAGDVVTPFAPGLGDVTQLGALGVLAWVAFTQRKELSELRKRHNDVIDTLCLRWDGWEKIRHTDSEKADGTLRELSTVIAAIRERLKSGETP